MARRCSSRSNPSFSFFKNCGVYEGEYTDSIVKANANSNAILFVNYGEGGAETMFVLPGDATDLTTLGVTNVVIYNANKVDYTDLIVNADFEKNSVINYRD